MLRRELLSKRDLAELVQSHFHIAFIEPDAVHADKMALGLLPGKLFQQHVMFPLRVVGDNAYLTKPVSPRILRLRIKALFRRLLLK